MINAKLSYDEGAGDFPIDNDYRRIGLVTNPLKFRVLLNSFQI